MHPNAPLSKHPLRNHFARMQRLQSHLSNNSETYVSNNKFRPNIECWGEKEKNRRTIKKTLERDIKKMKQLEQIYNMNEVLSHLLHRS